MACNDTKRRTVKNLVFDGKGYTPDDEWSIMMGGQNNEATRHRNAAVSIRVVPEIDVASGNVLFRNAAEAKDLINSCGFTSTFFLEGDEVVQYTNCSVTGHSELSDGAWALEISGICQ